MILSKNHSNFSVESDGVRSSLNGRKVKEMCVFSCATNRLSHSVPRCVRVCYTTCVRVCYNPLCVCATTNLSYNYHLTSKKRGISHQKSCVLPTVCHTKKSPDILPRNKQTNKQTKQSFIIFIYLFITYYTNFWRKNVFSA
jgi:hypothetical protein